MGLLRSTHHTCSREHGIMNGVRLDVTASTQEFNIDDHKVVDVFKVISDAILRMLRIASPDDHVTSGTDRYLPGNVPRKMKVPFSPPERYLGKISQIYKEPAKINLLVCS